MGLEDKRANKRNGEADCRFFFHESRFPSVPVVFKSDDLLSSLNDAVMESLEAFREEHPDPPHGCEVKTVPPGWLGSTKATEISGICFWACPLGVNIVEWFSITRKAWSVEWGSGTLIMSCMYWAPGSATCLTSLCSWICVTCFPSIKLKRSQERSKIVIWMSACIQLTKIRKHFVWCGPPSTSWRLNLRPWLQLTARTKQAKAERDTLAARRRKLEAAGPTWDGILGAVVRALRSLKSHVAAAKYRTSTTEARACERLDTMSDLQALLNRLNFTVGGKHSRFAELVGAELISVRQDITTALWENKGTVSRAIFYMPERVLLEAFSYKSSRSAGGLSDQA